MKTITTNGKTLIFVPVPDGAYEFEIKTLKVDAYFRFNYCISTNEYHCMAFLYKDFGGRKNYPSNLTFIATTDKINLVDKIDILGGGVFHSNSDWDSYFQAFLEIHSITDRHAIIEVL